MDADEKKYLVYKILTATTLMIPFDPDNPDTVDATAGMVKTEDVNSRAWVRRSKRDTLSPP
jgi:hypothetical protein